MYKQISAIVMSSSFPGWLAPLKFNPIRFIEFAGFGCTLVGSWVIAGLLVGGYCAAATNHLPGMLRRTSVTWLVSMPVASAQLVISTAAESQALVGDEGWYAKLPLAASGPGEPFTTAAGVLGVMVMWRAFYCTHLDPWSVESVKGVLRFREAVLMACVMAGTSALVLGALQVVVPQDAMENLDASIQAFLSHI
ncbi:hypothetical protein CEUSTIGMA_g6700.t1 [Chlamydomonas eustigma]|uniref:Uncharacterized protein n=1 Tax=Chlamydomonas eustigma TaxID=1157962 RepID=A0A250X913_9CHLO|nr:hypothetical protein CEUSTIGMA_g6700.t1 [Chlamydomonas eustigma]|eukprot:GAX79260.1 hypothetical protein CEUSTIGMA_g6700.t1 [Chlamydomonas eustigma]